ncbi:MAG: cadherin-like domain-containing protein, partial [Candidatus Poseidoniales archaeon]|nr:cadherin-like domain-containing protein [Candidatus Poseidoniales archaeon]
GWLVARNREDDYSYISDDISYLGENLLGAKLLFVAGANGPEDAVELGNVSNFSMLAMHRNGDFIATNDSGYEFNCTVIGHESISATGSIDSSTARSSCELNLDQLPPGMYEVLLAASYKGMPASLSVEVERGNTGMNQTDPIPVIILDQHGSLLVSAADFATDPDGQPIHFQNASWMAAEGEYFNLTIAGPNMTIGHTSMPEWSGSTLLALTLIESNTVNPETLDLVTQVTVVAVDDQVVSLGQIPSQQMYEDGDSLVLDVGPWFYDPEGEPLVVSASSSDTRLSVTINQTNITLTSALDWNGAAILTLNVSDGTTSASTQSIPVQIIPTDDEPKFDAEAWNLTFLEDETVIVDLSSLAWDPDGEEMVYVFSPDDSIGEFALLIEQGVLTLQPPVNFNGEMELGWLNASDEATNISHRLKVDIIPVNDIPSAQWQSATWQEKILVVEYSFLDVDGEGNHSVRYRIDDSQWISVTPICGGAVADLRQCSVMYNASELGVGGHTIDLVVVDEEYELDAERQVFTVASEQLPSGEDFSSVINNPSTWIVIVGLLLAIFLAKMLFSSDNTGGLVGAVQKESVEVKDELQKEVIELDEDESAPPEPESSGLLARAQNLKGR